MRPTRSRSTLWFAALVLVTPCLFLIASPAVAKPAAKAAKKHKPAAASAKSGDREDAAKKEESTASYETPSPAAAESPSGTAGDSTATATSTDTSTSTSTDTSTSTSTGTSTDTDKEKEAEKAEGPRPLAEAPAPPPPKEEPIPATVATGGTTPVAETPAPYVEHLGPKSFPGRLRGLYGGSLWLEPSFNGLQWPFMARTGVGASGVFWTDSGYMTIIRDDKTMANTRTWFQQGRGVLRLTPTYVRDRFFIQGQAELVGNQCQAVSNVCTSSGTFSTDDLWIRVGKWNSWDIKVGRFEAWEIYHLGMGMDMYTLERAGALQYGVPNKPNLEAPSFYGVNYMHDRPTQGLGVGYAALHAYFTEALRMELLGELGTDSIRYDSSNTDPTTTGHSYTGVRPAIIYDAGWMKFKAGAEYELRTAAMQVYDSSGNKQDSSYYRSRYGVGAALQFVVDPIIELGVNFAYGKQHEVDSDGNDIPANCYSTYTVGGFANLRLADLWLAGIGANLTGQTDSYGSSAGNGATNDFTQHVQTFLALQYLLAGQLFIRGVVAWERADFKPSNDFDVSIWSNYMYSARIRLMYLY